MTVAPIRPHSLLTYIEQEHDKFNVLALNRETVSADVVLAIVDRLRVFTRELRLELYKLEEGILVEQLEQSLELINRSPEAERRRRDKQQCEAIGSEESPHLNR